MQLLKSLLLVAIVATAVQTAVSTQAASLTQRLIEVGTSEPLTATDYTVQFDLPGSSNLGSIRILFCDNSPLPSEPCDPSAGFDASGAVLTDQSGETGFNVHSSTDTDQIILSRIPQPTTATTVNYNLNNIINPQSANKSYYARISTHESTDGTGPVLDSGSVALSTTQQLNVTLYVPPYLEFCVGISIVSHDCSTANGNHVDIGELSPNQTASGISKFLAATNAPGGYTVQVAGSTMASGNNVIDRLVNPTASTPGTNQFGLNLRANSSPSVGLEPNGPGSAQPTFKYNQVDNFAFESGDTVADISTSNDRVTFTASYITNVNDEMPPGRYNTTLTYICTGSF